MGTVPSFTSDTAPIKEVIQNNFNGILVDFYDIDLLVKNVNLILNNPKNYSNIRTSARKTINEKFELKKLLNKQIEFLNNCKVLYYMLEKFLTEYYCV